MVFHILEVKKKDIREGYKVEKKKLTCVSVLSHAEEVEARVDPAGDEDHEDTHEIKVVRGGHHRTKSLNNNSLTIRSDTFSPPYQQHGGCIQDPDGHIVTESYDISHFPRINIISTELFIKF